MKNWCKIISLPTHDVLVERISNHDDLEAVRVSARFDDHGAHLKATLGFEEDEQKADEAFENYDEAAAQNFLDGMLNMLEDNS